MALSITGVKGTNVLQATNDTGNPVPIADLTTTGTDQLLYKEHATGTIKVTSSLPSGLIPDRIVDGANNTEIRTTATNVRRAIYTGTNVIGEREGFLTTDPEQVTKFKLAGKFTWLTATGGLQTFLSLDSSVFTTGTTAVNLLQFDVTMIVADANNADHSSAVISFGNEISATGNWSTLTKPDLLLKILRIQTPLSEDYDITNATTTLNLRYDGGTSVVDRIVSYVVVVHARGDDIHPVI